MASKDQVRIQAAESIASEHRRELPIITYTGQAGLVTRDIPKDTVIKRLEIRMKGSFDVTYPAGAPVASPGGFISRIVPGGISIVADGSRAIKNVDAYLKSRSNLMHVGIPAERAFSTSVLAPTSHLAQTERSYGRPFDYPATTQFVVVNESFNINFECPWAYNFGKEASLFNTKNLSSAVIQFGFGPMTSLQEDGGVVAITYGNVNLQFIVTLVETPDVPRGQAFLDYRESYKRENFAGQSTGRAIDLPKGNLLAVIEYLVNDGDAALTLSDIALTDIKLMLNGSRLIQSTSFQALQQGYRMSRGISSPKGTASGGITHNMQGYAPQVLLKNGDIRTALDLSFQAGVDQAQLLLTTAAAAGVDAATYTNPVVVTLAFGEIVRVV